MRVQNCTQKIQVFGPVVIEPNSVDTLPTEYEESPNVKSMLELGMLRAMGLPKPQPEHVGGYREPAPTPPVSAIEEIQERAQEPQDKFQVPAGWEDFHTNKKYAWIKKCGSIPLLRLIKLADKDDKIHTKCDARIETLEARP